MIIVYCLDDNYTRYAEKSIESYRKHNPTAKIVVVSEHPLKQKLDYDEWVQITLPTTFRSKTADDRITNTAYLKLFLTELPYKKILYVDADTICSSSLDELWNLPCEYINLCESYKKGDKQARALGHERYGLTGMMVMNIPKLRQANFTGKCLEVEKSGFVPATGWQHDETCINVAMYDKLNFIDKKWNYCHNRPYQHPIPEHLAPILHYVGWEKNAMLYGHKYKEIYEIGKHINGANVAIVGNAKSIFDKEYGEEIDAHNFIIRFNKGFYAKPSSQGNRTTMLILACNLGYQEIKSYNARWVVNRSRHYYNPCNYTLTNNDRQKLRNLLGSQPSTGFMAIDICLYFNAKHIDLYGFDFEDTPTFYNPIGYQTQHDYPKEKLIVLDYEKKGWLTINR